MYAFIGLITTGHVPTDDKILHISICTIDDNGADLSWSTTIKPGLDVPLDVLKANAIDPYEVHKASPFYKHAKQIISLTEGRTLVAHDARYVYSFLKKEFKELGYTFSRKFICTQRLSREVWADLPAYGLQLCLRAASLPGGKSVALSAATKQLFTYLLDAESGDRNDAATRAVAEAANSTSGVVGTYQTKALLPGSITKQMMLGLPDAPGVYFFHNVGGEIIYVGKSVSIRKRIKSHFQIDLKSYRALDFKGAIHTLTYEETGSELVALLHESDLIKKLGPIYNVAQRQRHYGYCLESYKDAKGYLNLKIERLTRAQHPHFPISSILGGKGLLHNLVERYSLCQKLTGLYKTKTHCFDYVLHNCAGACIGRETTADYNARVLEALTRFTYPYDNFAILEPGRHAEETAVVLVEDSHYMGFGFVDKVYANGLADLKACISPKADNKDVQTIIRSYLPKVAKDRVLVF